MNGRGQWPLRPRQLIFVLLTALLTAAFSPSFVFATAANPPIDERHCGDIGVPGSGPTSSRLLGRSAQIFDAHQKNSPSHVGRCCCGDRAMGQRAVRGIRDVGIVLDGKIPTRGRGTRPGILQPS
jgi:hypothetical protein